MKEKFEQNWKRFLNESGFNRIINILSGGVPQVDSVAFITAANPMGEPLPAAENRLRNKDLAAWLREKGLGFIRIRGRFGSPERSFIVNNITREETIVAGKRFEQEAVIWGEKQFDDDGEPTGFRFYYIEGDQTIQVRDIVLSGPDTQDKEDFYSQERQSAGRKFLVPFFDSDYEIDMTEESLMWLDLPVLTGSQKKTHSDIIKEINWRSRASLEESRTPKSRWHHRKILQLRINELKKIL
jgi:hypothetical protein